MAARKRKEYGEYIVSDSKICGGDLIFKGTRVLVKDVLYYVAQGKDWDWISKGYDGRLSHEAIAEAVERAKRVAARTDRTEPRAKSARYDRRTNRMVVELRNGASFMFPAELAQGLAGASPKDLAEVQVMPSGAGLRWPNLDADLSLPNLLAGEFGSKSWMAKLGRDKRSGVGKEEPSTARSSRRSRA